MPHQLPLHDFHVAAGATMREHNGWLVPANYGDFAGEHEMLRGAAAILDVSDASRMIVAGESAPATLMAAMAGGIEQLGEARATRTLWTRPDGTIGDVVLVARTGERSYLLSGDGTQADETLAHIRSHLPDTQTIAEDRRMPTCWIAVAGPQAGDLLAALMHDRLPRRLEPMQVAMFEFERSRTLLVRTSDTGEDGFLIMAAPSAAQAFIEQAAATGARLCGRDAHETARVEAAITAFTPDLSEGITPSESGLDRLLNVPANPMGPEHSKRLAGVIFGENTAPPATGATLLHAGTPVGILRSCVASPTIGSAIGLVVLDAAYAAAGTRVSIDGAPATVVALPFLRKRLSDGVSWPE